MLEIFIPLFFIGGFVAIWAAVIRLLQRSSRMTDTVPDSAGPRLAHSGWGDATVNGARGTNCMRVERYAEGLAVRMHPLFGGGRVWLSDRDLSIEGQDEPRLRLRTTEHEVVLSGKLRDFMRSPRPTPVALRSSGTQSSAAPLGVGGKDHTGLAEPRHQSRLWIRLGLLLAALLIGYVIVRRTAPALVAPLDAWLGR